MTEHQTRRLILRPFQDRDRAPFAALNGDPEVMRWFPAPLDRAASDALIDRIEATRAAIGICFEALEDKETGAFLGMCGLHRTAFETPFTPCVEIGWRLVPAAWGRGYVTEAATAQLARAFSPDGLALPEVVAFTVTGNARSRAVMERLGMTRDPAEDFDHPNLPLGSPLRRHVLYRARNSPEA